MAPSIVQSKMEPKRINTVFQWKFPLLSFLVLSMIAWIGFQSIQNELHNNILNHLVSVHQSSNNALNIWIKEKQALANIWANNQTIRQNIQGLVQFADKRKKNGSARTD